MPWTRSLLIWCVIIAAESIHGTLRQLLLAPAIGDLAARQVSMFTGTVLILLIASAFARWLGARDSGVLIRVGALWVALTVLFEIALGRLVLGDAWARILADYDLPHGGLMGVGLLAMLFMPLAAARARGIRAA